MRNLVNLRRSLGALIAIVAVSVFAGAAGAEERSLLTPDGILYHVQSGLYKTFEPSGTAASPNDYVIHWDSRSQAGETLAGIIPGTDNTDVKDQFDIAYDSLSQSLFLVWNDRLSMINSVQFAIYQKGIWTQSQLLPSGVFSFADHPRILITHQTVQDLDADGNEVDSARSVISFIWWEDSARPHARFAPVFVENGALDLDDIRIYDLPELVGSASIVVSAVLQNPLYKNPSIQQDGFSSGALASFGDVASASLQVVRVGFPSDFRARPAGGRHSIVILGSKALPMPAAVPDATSLLGTIIGGGYQPTVYWQNDGASVGYTMAQGSGWSEARSVALSPNLGADAAIALIGRMAAQD